VTAAGVYLDRMEGQYRELRRQDIPEVPCPLTWHSVRCACDDCLDADYLICVRMSYMRWLVRMG
jgi:hypothetical protein